jgi:hypothetical protein
MTNSITIICRINENHANAHTHTNNKFNTNNKQMHTTYIQKHKEILYFQKRHLFHKNAWPAASFGFSAAKTRVFVQKIVPPPKTS